MAKVKIQTNLFHRFGKTITISNVDIIFDNKGESEIEESDVDAVKKADHTLIVTKIETPAETAKRLKKEKEEQDKLDKEEADRLKEEQILEEKKKEEELELKKEFMESYKFHSKGKELDPNLSIEEMKNMVTDLINQINKDKQNHSKELAKKNMEELQAMAKELNEQTEGKLPEEEWKSLLKMDLIKYLVEKAF